MRTKEEIIENLTNLNAGFTQKDIEKIAESMCYREVNEEIERNKALANTISPEKWSWLILNHKRLTITQEIQEYYQQMNTINKEMYQCICRLREFEDPFNKFMIDLGCKQLKGIIDCYRKFSHFDHPDQFLLDLCKQYYLKYNPVREVGRPKEQHLIKMIDTETEEVFERFNTRDAVMETIGIKKSNLSQCLKSSNTNPNAKATWRKYKYEGRKYWFVEEN